MNKNSFVINITIEGRAYPLEIDRADEEAHRLAAKMVNETIAKFKEVFGKKDTQDILAMTAFQVALNNIDLNNRVGGSLFVEELKNLNDDISDFVEEHKKK